MTMDEKILIGNAFDGDNDGFKLSINLIILLFANLLLSNMGEGNDTFSTVIVF